jgi:predicted FMN-binding regulatory protein PaiB
VKSFLVLFFKKEPLAFWAGTEAKPIPQESGSRPVGITLKITRLQDKWKLGQNRNAADRAGLLAGYGSEHGRYAALAAVARAANKQE